MAKHQYVISKSFLWKVIVTGNTEQKTLEWSILNPDRLINLEIRREENKHNLISRLRKRVDQAIIPISTILKFPAQSTSECRVRFSRFHIY